MLAAADRAELVAALRAVDYVVVFPDATVARLLELLKPDVHCKGTDYTADSVPERETVRAYGGRSRSSATEGPFDHRDARRSVRSEDAGAAEARE